MAVSACAFVQQASAQFDDVWAPRDVRLEREANLFLQWNGDVRVDGFLVDLPVGWALLGVTALRHGYVQVPLGTRKLKDGTNRFVVASKLRGKHDIVLHVKAGSIPGRTTWSVVPFWRSISKGSILRRPLEGYRVTRRVRHGDLPNDRLNRVLERTAEDTPLILRFDHLPRLGSTVPFTLELWLKTVRLGTVVVSTWDGNNNVHYPLELTIDLAGRLRYYRSHGERHASMSSEVPVADGAWHHVAVTHDPEALWSYLYIDGFVVDSLYSPAQDVHVDHRNLAIGHRLQSDEASTAYEGRFVGSIDEVRIWPETRTADEIRTAMRQTMTTERRGPFVLGFEEAPSTEFVARGSGRATLVNSDLVFYGALQNFTGSASVDGIRLTWEVNDLRTAGFIIERSTNGVDFELIGELRSPESEGNTFTFTDRFSQEDIVFYRLRQLFVTGEERLSGTIKLGLGEDGEPSDEIILDGNFPNPFNPTTTISYTVREPQHVRLSVWDLSGQMVADLVDTERQVGTFTVDFDGSDFPSGTYFVRLQGTSGALKTRKIVLAK